MIERIYADSIEASIQRDLANPGPAPGQASFRLGSFLKAGGTGPLSGAFDVAGGAADLLSGYATADAAAHGDDEASKALLEGRQFDATAGNALRRKADEFAPDPQTASTADQVMHGLTRGVTKAVAAVGAAGPVAGAAVFGLEEGNNEYQRLREKGIDHETALKVAGVTAATSAIGAGAPAGGSTALRTMLIAGAAGPGTYVAQQALSKEILQSAGYQHEADQHDPTDALGLMLSIGIPGAVGALHIRNLNRAKIAAAVQEVESGGRRYGKDGKLLTSPKGAQGEMQVMPATAKDPGFGVTPAKDDSPEELARVGRDYSDAMVARYGDADKAMAAYNGGPGAVDRAVKAHGENWLAHMPDETKAYVGKGRKILREDSITAAARDPAIADAARVQTLDAVVAERLPARPEAYAEVMRATDEVAAGEPFLTPVMAEEMRQPTAMAEDLRGLAGGAFWAQMGGKMIRDPDSGDVTARTPWVPAQEWFGAMRSDLGRGGLSTQEEIASAVEKAIAGQPLRAAEKRTVDWMRQEVDKMREESSRYHWLLGDREFADDIAAQGLRHTDVADAALVTRAAQLDEGRVERAAIAHEADDAAFMGEIRRILDEHGADTNPSPIAGREGASSAPIQRARAADNSLPEAGGSLAEVDTPRDTPLPRVEGGPPDAAAAKALERLQAETPTLPVKLPGSDETITLETALERIEAQRADEAQEADWVKVALECALSGGSKPPDPAAP